MSHLTLIIGDVHTGTENFLVPDKVSAPVTKIMDACRHSKAASLVNVLDFVWFGVVAKAPNVGGSLVRPRR